MKKVTLLGAWFALLALGFAMLTACGGDDDDDDTGLPDFGAGGDGEGNDDDDDDDGDSDGFDFGSGTARVTVGDTTYEFELSEEFVVCREVFGAIQIAGPSVEGDDITVNAVIPPTDWEDHGYDPPSIQIADDGNNAQWVADEGQAEFHDNWPEESRVNSYEIDGLTASGTATFIDQNMWFRGGRAEPMEGSFEINCEEE